MCPEVQNMHMDLNKQRFVFGIVNTSSTDIGEEDNCTFTHIEENADEIVSVKKSAQNRIYKRLLFRFQSDIEKYPNLVEGHFLKAKEYFARTLDKIAELEPDNVIFSLTHSKSLYFRIYKGNYRAHLEVFFDYDGSDDDVEMVSTIYSLDNQALNIASDLENGFSKIKNEVAPNINTTSVKLENKYELAF